MPLYKLDEYRPELPSSGRVWIAPDAQVIGHVRLGDDVSIWFGVVIRGDNELIDIGAGSNIQDGTVIHTDPGAPLVVGKGCTIGHKAMLHGCILGENVLIGMGATVLNGARIGRNCIVGANALVREGAEFPDGSLIVGMPAKAIRSLDSAGAADLQRLAEHYVGNARRFAAGLVHQK